MLRRGLKLDCLTQGAGPKRMPSRKGTWVKANLKQWYVEHVPAEVWAGNPALDLNQCDPHLHVQYLREYDLSVDAYERAAVGLLSR